MSFSIVIEIIASVFIVYGLYYAAKSLMYRIVYEKNIRNAVYIAVRIDNDDSDETKKLKIMCARQLAHEFLSDDKVCIINKETEEI